MRAKSYRFNVGQIECAVLLDGASILGRERILKRYPTATEAEYEQAYADVGLSLDTADTSLNILLIKTADEVILVDAGEGGKPNGGHLVASLALVDVTPSDITQIVLTHTHGDHVMGLLTDDDQPTFPNARYVISRQELAFWRERIAAGGASHQPILSLLEAQSSRLRVIEMDEHILPGMTAVPLPGHTPGMIGVMLDSNKERLLHVADMLHSPMQFGHPEWSPTFDADTTNSVQTRRAMLTQVANEHLLTLFFHLTFPGLGLVEHHEHQRGAFVWKPIPHDVQSN